jgi:hypothetical protein
MIQYVSHTYSSDIAVLFNWYTGEWKTVCASELSFYNDAIVLVSQWQAHLNCTHI